MKFVNGTFHIPFFNNFALNSAGQNALEQLFRPLHWCISMSSYIGQGFQRSKQDWIHHQLLVAVQWAGAIKQLSRDSFGTSRNTNVGGRGLKLGRAGAVILRNPHFGQILRYP